MTSHHHWIKLRPFLLQMVPVCSSSPMFPSPKSHDVTYVYTFMWNISIQFPHISQMNMNQMKVTTLRYYKILDIKDAKTPAFIVAYQPILPAVFIVESPGSLRSTLSTSVDTPSLRRFWPSSRLPPQLPGDPCASCPAGDPWGS